MNNFVDKSDYFASITCINGCLNGSSGPYCLDLCEETFKIKEYGTKYGKATWLSNGY